MVKILWNNYILLYGEWKNDSSETFMGMRNWTYKFMHQHKISCKNPNNKKCKSGADSLVQCKIWRGSIKIY